MLDALTWPSVLVVLVFVFVVRPLTGLAVAASELGSRRDVLAVSWFGIRGVGSIYYLAFALGAVEVSDADARQLLAITTLTIVVSLVVHGVTAPLADRDDRASR